MLRLELIGISKQYPAVRANDNVNLKVQPGEIHAVLGENGAGKSTMMKMIYGAVRPDEGEIRWNGEKVDIKNPQQARALGISMVFQHFSLFDTLTAAENVWLGLDKSMTLAEVTERIGKVSKDYGLDVAPLRPVHSLSVGERQRVEIVRALLTSPKLLILDEPTSVLTPQAVQKLFVTLRQLSANGTSILYISHKLDEIRALCHHCTVLRGGKVTGTVDPRTESNAGLSKLMIGAEPPQLQHQQSKAGDVVLAVKGLSCPKLDQFGTTLADIAFDVRAGEIVGVAGVSGNGQRELVEALAGQRDVEAGRMLVHGEVYTATRPEMVRHKVACLPEEPLRNACVADMSVAENIALRSFDRPPSSSNGIWLKRGPMRDTARKLIEAYKVKTPGPAAAIRGLSGGNVQRAVLARELSSEGDLLIVANPCFGLDFAAVAEIRARIVQARNRGAAVLLVSEDLDEILQLSDRIVVMFDGKLALQTDAAAADVGAIGRAMAGH